MKCDMKDMYECDIFIVTHASSGFEKKYYVIKNRYTRAAGIVTNQEFINLLEISKKPIVVSLDFFEGIFKEDIIGKIRRAEMKDLIVGGDSL